MSSLYPYTKGRPNDKLALLFKVATLVGVMHHYGDDAKPIKFYEAFDGEGVVKFHYNTWSDIVEVYQPGVCLFTKMFETNNERTKFKQI